MASSTAAAAAQPSRVIRGGLKLKGGIVIRSAPPPAAAAHGTSAAATAKRKQPSDTQTESIAAASLHQPVKAEPESAPSPPSPPQPGDEALPSDAPTYVKRTRRADEVEQVNAQLQQLNRAAERSDRRQLIADDRRRVAEQQPAAAAEAREADGLRLVEVSRGYVKHGFGDESAMTATRRLNDREKKRSDRYCK